MEKRRKGNYEIIRNGGLAGVLSSLGGGLAYGPLLATGFLTGAGLAAIVAIVNRLEKKSGEKGEKVGKRKILFVSLIIGTVMFIPIFLYYFFRTFRYVPWPSAFAVFLYAVLFPQVYLAARDRKGKRHLFTEMCFTGLLCGALRGLVVVICREAMYPWMNEPFDMDVFHFLEAFFNFGLLGGLPFALVWTYFVRRNDPGIADEIPSKTLVNQ
jgi:hypothetical protein